TRTGPGTPCGDLMRRYWQPVALAEELPVGGAPLPVRLLGEDLVLFRTPGASPLEGRGQGEGSNIGLLNVHCSHRGADLSYGRLEDGGLRCIYHGWLYDIYGRCLEQPGEPAGSSFHEKIRHTAYPCLERAGAIFAYLGPGQPPEFPNYEFLSKCNQNAKAWKYYHECNYLQAHEGNVDLAHLHFLHYQRGQDETQNGVRDSERLRHRGMVPGILACPFVTTPYGVRSGRVCGSPDFEGQVMYATEFVLPSFTAVPNDRVSDARDQDGYFVLWHVPIDDTHHWKFYFDYSRRGLIKRGPRTETVDHRPVRDARNRYGQDREEMADRSYAGMGQDFVVHDKWATEGQGAVQDRTGEHLGAGDQAVVAARQVLLKAIQDLQRGREPANVVRDPDCNHLPIAPFIVQVARGTDWEAYGRYVEQLAGPDGEWTHRDGNQVEPLTSAS
ncbi:MAG TPA: Rieske 2Fe-2S domain-containing protein, partial [Chloroflexota bacterium]